ncbi:MAG: hypothetical protein KAR47_00190 [Planctomycetes bacterium]|nr:hypothetical protein [Planctomycetota bacterium]
MEISEKCKQEMEAISTEMQNHGVECRKDFRCYRSSLENLCKVKGIGVFDTIECADEGALCCGLSFAAVGKRYCKCPLRRYIAVHFCR